MSFESEQISEELYNINMSLKEITALLFQMKEVLKEKVGDEKGSI